MKNLACFFLEMNGLVDACKACVLSTYHAPVREEDGNAALLSF